MDSLHTLQDFLNRIKEFQKPVYQTILLLSPTGGSTYAWRKSEFFGQLLLNQLTQAAAGFLGTLLVAVLSGISVTALATFLITSFIVLLILNRVFGIEILVPKFSPFQA